MASRADGLRLIALFNSLWKGKYGSEYLGNRHADQWGFIDMIDDLGEDVAKDTVKYYFRLNKAGHPRTWLLYHYHDVAKQMEEASVERSFRDEIKEQTRLRRMNEG